MYVNPFFVYLGIELLYFVAFYGAHGENIRYKPWGTKNWNPLLHFILSSWLYVRHGSLW